jgi:GTP-binding protein
LATNRPTGPARPGRPTGPLKITTEFVTSAAHADGVPRDARPHLALVGRSNVGKSSLINALARHRIARTSATPGKTRLVNVYRVAHGDRKPFYLVDLPGYGYARGGSGDFARLTGEYFAAAAGHAGTSAILLVDARHPGLERDREAWEWLKEAVDRAAVVATKIDKLARGERIRALRDIESVFDSAVLPVSAVTGEGMDKLWNLIDRLTTPNRTRSRRA